MQIFEALRESHDRQRSLADALIETHGDSPERAMYYEQLKEELLAHARAEERFFYSPLMQHDTGVSLSRHGVAEHHEMDEMLETLEEVDPSSPSWISTARKLRDKIFHHLEDEEHTFFQQAGKILTEEQKTSLATKYARDYKDFLS
jgi:iron-sulfur cluster repair protein YtfE (RIC family)